MYLDLCDFLSGWVSGASGILIGHPGDTVKVRQQTEKKAHLIKTIKTIYRNEGIAGYYKGVVFPVLSTGVTNSIFFGFYGGTLRFLLGEHKKSKSCESVKKPGWLWNTLVAGGVGGFFSVFIGCPVELVKTQLQMNKGKKSIGTFGMVKKIYRDAGIPGLYKGLSPMFLRDIPGYAFYVTTFEYLVCTLKEGSLIDSALLCEMISGGFAGVASWAPLMPADVIKSRIQGDSFFNPKYKGIVDCALKTYRNEGLSIFYKGTLICMLRAFPVNVVTFTVYSNLVKVCYSRTQGEKPK